MGGNKSKPYAEAAKHVIARRQKEAVTVRHKEVVSEAIPSENDIKGVSPNVHNTPIAAAISKPRHIPQVNEMDPNLLHKISQWNIVQTTSKDMITQQKNLPMSAAEFRFQELRVEDQNKKNNIIRFGRLTETQLVELYTKLRDGDNSHDKLANEYKIDESLIQQLSSSARMPIVVIEGKEHPIKVAM